MVPGPASRLHCCLTASFRTDCATGVAAEEVFAGLTTLYKVTALVRCLRHLKIATCRQAEQKHSNKRGPENKKPYWRDKGAVLSYSVSYLEDP